MAGIIDQAHIVAAVIRIDNEARSEIGKRGPNRGWILPNEWQIAVNEIDGIIALVEQAGQEWQVDFLKGVRLVFHGRAEEEYDNPGASDG